MDLVSVYGRAERELRAWIRAIDPIKFDAETAGAIRKRARRLVTELDLAAKRWVDTDLRKSYSSGVTRARVSLEILGRRPRRRPVAGITGLQDGALETLVRANVSILGTVDDILEAALSGAMVARSVRIQEFDRRKALKRFAELGEEAVALEASRGELSSKILEYLLDQLDDNGFINIKGKFWNPRKYAKLVARTEMRFAQTRATEDLCQQYENDLVQWSDHKTVCEICKPFEGKIYSLSGADLKYPRLMVRPPAHPNCKHSLLPTSHEAVAARRRWN